MLTDDGASVTFWSYFDAPKTEGMSVLEQDHLFVDRRGFGCTARLGEAGEWGTGEQEINQEFLDTKCSNRLQSPRHELSVAAPAIAFNGIV
jgi:hypothetical protein